MKNNNLEKLVKTQEQITIMREGGKILATMLGEIEAMINPGVAVMDLESKFIEMCNSFKVRPACKGYAPYFLTPFPTGLCVSINSQCVHSYPKKDTFVKNGDLITIDTVIEHKGLMVDSSFAKGAGDVDLNGLSLLDTSKQALYNAINLAIPGNRIGDLSNAMFKTAKAKGFDVLREFAGHGIGKSMHENPEIACYGKPNTGPELIPGLTICIEALVCEGKPVVVSVDDWETRMRDGKRFAQFEHTILITKGDPEILTSL
jgi:methionyl aminopeptidase